MKGYLEQKLKDYIFKEVDDYDHREILYYLIRLHSYKVSDPVKMKANITNLINTLRNFHNVIE